MGSQGSRQSSEPRDGAGHLPGTHGTGTHGTGVFGTGATEAGAVGTGSIEAGAGPTGRLAALARILSAPTRAMRVRRTEPAAEVPPFPIWPY